MTEATIGSALSARRLELGISRVQAAAQVGMSRTTYSSYESDSQRPSVDVFPALAEFLNITIEELLALYGATVITVLRPSLEQVLLQSHAKTDREAEPTQLEESPDERHWLSTAAVNPDDSSTASTPRTPSTQPPSSTSSPPISLLPSDSPLPSFTPSTSNTPSERRAPSTPLVNSHEMELTGKKKKKKGKKKKR